MMKITVFYFAQLREEIGLSSEKIEHPYPITGKQLLAKLGEKHGFIKVIEASLSMAVVALIPPVSGG